ncbi:MAG: DUF1570 domain-containing protein [Planctomycetota bacterium]|jgi:hypothetical protein
MKRKTTILLLLLASCGKENEVTPNKAKYDLSESDIKYIAAALEMTFCKSFNMENNHHSKNLKVEISENREDFNKLLSEGWNDDYTKYHAFYSQRTKSIHMLDGLTREAAHALATHESTHYLNHMYFGLIDTWLDEGLASFFSVFATFGDFASKGENEFVDQIKCQIRNNFKDKKLPPVETLLMLKQGSDFEYASKEYSERNYGGTFALIYYLFSTDGVQIYNSIIQYIHFRNTGGKAYTGSKQAFKKAFNVKLYEMNERIDKFYFDE